MFTGIVEELGTIRKIGKDKPLRLIVCAEKVLEGTKIGDSISVNGVCLTVSHIGKGELGFDVMPETLRRSVLKDLRLNSRVNLERAMRADGRFGGHMVSGHVDGIGRIKNISKNRREYWLEITADDNILSYLVEKGSVAVDGVSLTVVEVKRNTFTVSLIPVTLHDTVLGIKRTNEYVNLEIDIVAKYLHRFLGQSGEGFPRKKTSKVTSSYLQQMGF